MNDTSFIKVCGGLDVNPIVDSLLSNPQLWDENPARRVFKGSPHSQMTDIWVRFGDTSNGDLSVLGREHDSVWYPSSSLIAGIKEFLFPLVMATTLTSLWRFLVETALTFARTSQNLKQ